MGITYSLLPSRRRLQFRRTRKKILRKEPGSRKRASRLFTRSRVDTSFDKVQGNLADRQVKVAQTVFRAGSHAISSLPSSHRLPCSNCLLELKVFVGLRWEQDSCVHEASKFVTLHTCTLHVQFSGGNFLCKLTKWRFQFVNTL